MFVIFFYQLTIIPLSKFAGLKITQGTKWTMNNSAKKSAQKAFEI